MKFEYISTARLQGLTGFSVLMYTRGGVKTFKTSIENGATAEDVAKKLENLAKDIRAAK